MAYKRIPDDNIVNIDVAPKISGTWLANVRHIVEHGADFFVTGNEYIQVGVNLKFIPAVHTDTSTRRGGVLADAGQTLRQSYLTAKHVFAHVAPGTIKFVLIGLDPQSFCRDEFRADLVNDDFQNVFDTVTNEQADLNFDAVKAIYNGGFSMKAINDWQDASQTFSATAVKNNAQILTEYIELCLANGAKPVGVVLPVARAVRKYYNAELLKSFRDTIRQREEISAFTCIDLFDLELDYDSFFDMTHLNVRGQVFVNSLLSTKLHAKNFIPIESFCDMTYDYLNYLSYVAPKDEYNAFMERVFEKSAEMIRRKNKIKLGFVMCDSSMWCGDDLYNLFARDEHFEPTVFMCLRKDKLEDELMRRDFLHGVEQFKQRGLNVIAIDKKKFIVPAQDVLIFLVPYSSWLIRPLKSKNLRAKILTLHITYSFAVVIRAKSFYNRILFHTAWKIFFASPIVHKAYDSGSIVGIPRGFYSGFPRLDVFFKRDTQFKFDWKMIRPDAKKIIWAPHHSIKGVTFLKFATFQWNFKFMYEFAKSHPEISWVVKPHQALLYSAVEAKVFPSAKAFEEYLQAWNDLPNAQVYTGAYYQDIFATSDGMIHDCGSFIAEYQYVDKPMIYLTRGPQRYNELVKQIMDVSYLVDGQDFDAIAATIQRVIIDGDDYKAADRRELFDEHLNYPKTNGMLASEFIYHSIADELKETPE